MIDIILYPELSILHPSTSTGIFPFWATKNLKQVPREAIRPVGYEQLQDLCDGSVESNCPKPCEFV